VSLPQRLEVQLTRFETDADAAVVGGQVLEFGSWGGPVRGDWPTTDDAIRERIDRFAMPVAHCAAAMKRSSVVAAGGYDELCLRAQDYALFLRMRGLKFVAVPEPVVMYRTQRPVPLRYAILSGRYGHLARERAVALDGLGPSEVTSGMRALPVDVKSTLGWLRRRVREGSVHRAQHGVGT